MLDQARTVRLLAGLSLSLLTACGGPAQTITSPSLEDTYPARAFIAARGYADTDPAAAARAARAEVSRMVRSQITSTLLLDQQSHNGVDEEHTRHRVKERSSFEHSELIHIDRARSRCDARRCEAVAYLKRGEASRVLGAEYAPISAAFRREATAAASTEAPVAFTASLRRAEADFKILAPKGYALQVITGARWPAYVEDRASMERLKTKRTRLAGALRVKVLPPKISDEAAGGPLRDALLTAIKQMGLNAEAARACTTGIALSSEAEITCGRGQLGPTCTLQLNVRLLRCPSDEIASPDLSGVKLRGVSARDETDARRRLIKRLRADTIQPILRAGLAPFLPVR